MLREMRNAVEKKTGRLGRNVKMKRLRKFPSRSRIKPAIGSKKCRLPTM